MGSRTPKRKKRSKLARRVSKYSRRALMVLALVGVVALLVWADRLGLFGTGGGPDYQRYHDKQFTVTKVVDGDTLDVGVPDATTGKDFTRIRLWGVDTPEVHGGVAHFGPEASAYSKEQALHRAVRLELDPSEVRGKYGRVLAYVYLPDGRMLNRELIRLGLGYADPRFSHDFEDEFALLQRDARQAGRGLWADITKDKLPKYLRHRIKLAK